MMTDTILPTDRLSLERYYADRARSEGLTSEARRWAIDRALQMPRESYATVEQVIADAAAILAFVEGSSNG